MIKKMLIANRGEIALRILRTCKEMGIATVAVYSQADQDALHVRLADEAVCIGAAPASASYLKSDNVLEAALLTGCDSIHPGYGFLSENARFASLVRQCGMIFIGPSSEVIEKLGNKINAIAIMKAAGIPTIPGSGGAVESIEDALAIAKEIGYPILFKAASGGGGKGMRIARCAAEIIPAFHAAKSDVHASFGNDVIYMERYLEQTKHIEVQILADQHQHILHLFERDCSFQRKHQKLIEEAPCEMLPDEVRQRIIQDALKAVTYVGYDNVGTVEFLVDQAMKHYFIEVNTRIQVEHTISEMITGIDIVKCQIQSADNLPLSIKQSDVRQDGYALECRINAEDVRNHFTPQPGFIQFVHFPAGRNIRIESAVYNGTEISPFYDPLIIKVITHGKTRLEAIETMKIALDEIKVEGLRTNIEFQNYVLHSKSFTDGKYTTAFANTFIRKFLKNPRQFDQWKEKRLSLKGQFRKQTTEINKLPVLPLDIQRCESCFEPISLLDLTKYLFVCKHCGFHFRIGVTIRIQQLIDESTFEEMDSLICSHDTEHFPGYTEKLLKATQATGLNEAVVCGTGKINGTDVCIGILDANFMMGTMGYVVGDKITRLIERATALRYPLVLVCASGGARMQEGIVSLMQMAKTAAALARFEQAGLLYISVLTNPTTGGVSASFAMLGDIQIAEPRAVIGFAGKRVIEKTIGETLPDAFQTSEFLLEKGFLDSIVQRKELKQILSELLVMHQPKAMEYSEPSLSNIEEPLQNAMSAWDRVILARHSLRPKASDLLPLLIDRFIPLHGDRCFGDDPALIGGIGYFNGIPVTVLAQNKGKDLSGNLHFNFGMMHPEGYRKIQRLARQAQKFNRPILTIIDTPGAYPGKGAEERGQAAAIAECLKLFSTITVPVIALVLSEGGSGGALALSVADRIFMLENAVYSILSPEGFASILWKDESKAQQAAEIIKLTAFDLKAKGIIDSILKEPSGGAQTDMQFVAMQCKTAIARELNILLKLDTGQLIQERYAKFRKIGTIDQDT